jgi:large subunit ribosomal protein L6
MSRVGNAPIEVPAGVEINVADNNVVSVKGPKGELIQKIDPDMKISIEDGSLTVVRPSEAKPHKAKHGLSRALINNMVVGVTEGYKTQQELVGVGYRATVQGQQLQLVLGYSHAITLLLPTEIKVSAEQVKGKNPVVTLESCDKQLIGQVAAKIRSLRKPEPYKGKGIRFVGEHIRRKAGKAAG